MAEYHYVYKLTDTETGEYYIGVRTCKCEISEDRYMGSMKTWKPDKEKLEKVILRQFNCRSYAERWESVTIFKHLTNPLNRNYSLNRNHLTKTQRKQYNWIIRLKCKSLD